MLDRKVLAVQSGVGVGGTDDRASEIAKRADEAELSIGCVQPAPANHPNEYHHLRVRVCNRNWRPAPSLSITITVLSGSTECDGQRDRHVNS